jgi:hypothetical protein
MKNSLTIWGAAAIISIGLYFGLRERGLAPQSVSDQAKPVAPLAGGAPASPGVPIGPPRPVYGKAESDLIRQHFMDLVAARRIPEFEPLYLKPGEHRVITQKDVDGSFGGPVRFAEGVTIDGKDFVGLLYRPPIVEVKPGQSVVMAFMTIPDDVDEFVNNGVFTSTVDLESVSTRILARSGKTWQQVASLPAGTYVWHIGKRGAWLTGGTLVWDTLGVPNYKTDPAYMLEWEKRLEEIPTGTFISVLRMQPMQDTHEGFEIGGPESLTIVPTGSATGEVRPKPVVRLRMKGANQSGLGSPINQGSAIVPRSPGDPRKSGPADLLPGFHHQLPTGANELRVRNPNSFGVLVGIRSREAGKDFNVGANGSTSIYVPDGAYDIYFVYSHEPDAAYQGDSFTLDGNGVEIQIVKVVGGNYRIRRVK